MAAAMHLTLVAPDNEKCTVQSAPGRLGRRKASLQAQDQAMNPNLRLAGSKALSCREAWPQRRKR
jgi:hypothetical protein